jgi:hypothetical protein
MIEHLMTTPNHGPRSIEPIRPRIIVLHDTEAEGNSVDYLANNSAPVSVQYVVDRNGDVYHIGLETWACYHAGATRVQLSDGLHMESANRFSVGIEIAHISHHEPYPIAQRTALEDLILSICSRWPIEKVLGHADVCYPKGRKTDPELNPAYYTLGAIRLRRSPTIKGDYVQVPVNNVAEETANAAQASLVKTGRLSKPRPYNEAAGVGLVMEMCRKLTVEIDRMSAEIIELKSKLPKV